MKAHLWLAALLLLPTLAVARNVQLRITPSPDPVARYHPDACTGSGCTDFTPLNQPWDAPCGNPCAVTVVVPDPMSNVVMCFGVRAENAAGLQSVRSNTVCQTIPTMTTTSTSATSTSSTSSTSSSSSSSSTSTSSTTSTTRPRPPVLLDATIARNGRLKGVYLAKADLPVAYGTQLRLLFTRPNGTVTTYGGFFSGTAGPTGYKVGPAGRIKGLDLPIGNDNLDGAVLIVEYAAPDRAASWVTVDRSWLINDKRS